MVPGKRPRKPKAPRRGTNEWYRAEAKRIAIAYRDGLRALSREGETIGQATRSSVRPRDRPRNVLARGVYQLAKEALISESVGRIEKIVRKRDEPFVHKPRNPTEVDWIIRLVNRSILTRNKSGFTTRNPILTPKEVTELGTELNFAFFNLVNPQIVDAFIHTIGGYEHIPQNRSKWIKHVNDDAFLESILDHKMVDFRRSRSKSNDEDDD